MGKHALRTQGNAVKLKIKQINIMADFQLLGHISNIKYLPDCILIYVDENKSGYTKPNGERVDARILSWKCIFSGNEKKRGYISKYFNRGMLVQIKGEILPYSIEHGEMKDGVTIFVQAINRYAYPTTGIKRERKMIMESQLSSDEKPDLDAFNTPDF